MSTREALHQLVDALPEDVLPAVARYLAAVQAGAPPDVEAEDDVPLSPEEEALLAASRADLARGAVLTHEELLARRAARRHA